jgi:hypothetical protein
MSDLNLNLVFGHGHPPPLSFVLVRIFGRQPLSTRGGE